MGLPKFPDAETRHKKLVYIKNNWQLYVFFALDRKSTRLNSSHAT